MKLILQFPQALNNLQSTVQGFGHVNSENVFKVCDEPHPMLIKDMLDHCIKGNIDEAYVVCIYYLVIRHFSHYTILQIMSHLYGLGYAAEDIVSSVFRVCRNHSMPEYLLLEFVQVKIFVFLLHIFCSNNHFFDN